jgi:hypothetical protein
MTLDNFRIRLIVPAERTNLIINPSFELGTTGYTASSTDVTIARVTTQSRRGAASLEVATVTTDTSGVYFEIALTSDVTYTFSADIKDVNTDDFELYIADTSNALKSTKTTWTGSGYWKRRSVTWKADASATFRLFATRAASDRVTTFYTNGWQMEVGAESTYIDGDQTGFVSGETAYRWNGTRHASQSWRSSQTRSGGTYLDLSTYGKVQNIIGLGMAGVTNVTQLSTMGGSYFQNTVAGEREFTIIETVYGASADYSLVEKARAAIINAIKPDPVTNKQPMLMQIDQLDDSGLEIAETLMVPVLYQGGLEGDGSGNLRNEKLMMSFKACSPYLPQEGETGLALGYQTSVANANMIIQRATNGTWAELAGGANDDILNILPTRDGYVYASGRFTALGGGVGDYFARWNGTAWASLTAIPLTTDVFATVEAPDGSIILGGNFIGAGTSDGDYIVKYSAGSFSALGTGANDIVGALAYGQDGCLYAGGSFTSMSGTSDTARIAKWDGSNWSALSTGIDNGTVNALAFAPDGTLYIGGSFTDVGDANGDRILKWNGTAFSSLGTGAASGQVNAIAVGPDGSVYVGGTFSGMGGITNTAYIAKWNGTAWESIASAMNGDVWCITIGPDNKIYVGGSFLTDGRAVFPDRVAMYNGSVWIPLDVNLSGTPKVYAISFDRSGVLYLGYDVSGTATAATVTAANAGTASAHPRIWFTGPGTIYQVKNYTTGKAIYFDDLTLMAGETACLDLNPLHVSFVSDFRGVGGGGGFFSQIYRNGNIMNKILPGSDLTFELLPGANNISAYMFGGTTSDTAITMIWKDQYWSIDGAVR